MTTLKVEKRDLATKAKKLRREGYITGSLYGRQIEGSVPLKINRQEAAKVLRGCTKGSQIMLDVEGTVYDVLIKEMDYDSIRNIMLEIDFQALVSNEKVHSTAEIIIHNKDKIIGGGVLEQVLQEVAFKAYPSALVDKVYVDASKLRVGDVVRVKDLDIASDKEIDITSNPESVVCSVLAVHEQPEEAETEAAEEK